MALDPDTVLAPGSAEAALRAAGAGIAAVDAVMHGEVQRVFCAVRPPGHHATATVAMGFCLFNNIAVAAAHACDKHGLARVAVVDFDVHHGNGTQAIFDTDPRVMYLSSHQMPLYPDTGYANERGVGNIVNAPLPPACGSEAFRVPGRSSCCRRWIRSGRSCCSSRPGFDGHKRDPLAQLELETDDFAWLTRATGRGRQPPWQRPDRVDARRRLRPVGVARMQRGARRRAARRPEVGARLAASFGAPSGA